jgi:hypothetical protein
MKGRGRALRPKERGLYITVNRGSLLSTDLSRFKAFSPGFSPMPNPKIIHELAIVFAVQDSIPQSLHLDFLKYNGVVPADWQLAQPPIRNQQINRLIFQNDVHIVSQAHSLTLVQPIVLSHPEQLQVPELAQRYIKSLGEDAQNYLAIGISPKSLVLVNPVAKSQAGHVVETLLKPSDWQYKGDRPAQATVNLLYPLDRCQFKMTLEDVKHQMPDRTEVPAVLVSGNFHYPLSEEGDRSKQLSASLDHWKKDLRTYLEIVNQRFLDGKGDRPAQKPKAAKTKAARTPAAQTAN